MRNTLFLLVFLIVSIAGFAQDQGNTITISGRVTDFDDKPISNCKIRVLRSNFTDAYVAYTDKDGFYSVPNVEKGKYMAIYALRMEEYPRELKVAEKDMRLEFWAWNVIADKDLTINPRYHRLELYGTTVFKENGGYPTIKLYVRPMSLGRMLAYGEAIYQDKKKAEAEEVDISAEPENIEFKVWADDEPVEVRYVQPVREYIGGGRLMAYLLDIDLPKKQTGKYCIFRVEAFNNAFGGEKGENVYFYEYPGYK
ncbi:MAG: carboxypeptidase-like regulatory domain-containing protein [Dysgonomonas sp.]